MRWMVRPSAISVVAISFLIGPEASGVAPAAEPPLSDEFLDLLQVSAPERRRLGRGEIVSYPVTDNGERELAVGLAMFVPVPVGQLADYLAAGHLIEADAAIAAHGIVPDEPGVDALPDIRFTRGEQDETQNLLEASPGLRLNLSLAEIERLHALRTSTSSRARLAEIATDEYRRLLVERWQAYRQSGLAGMPPYARSGGTFTDPAAELRLAAADTDRLARHGRPLREALLAYPVARLPQAIERFYWIKRHVQRRPMWSLLHQLVVAAPDLVIHVERSFYVGHSYNAAQIITGALVHGDGTLVFATSRFSTDEVLGVGNQLKRSVGRGQLRDEMRKRLDRLRASMSRPPSVQSP